MPLLCSNKTEDSNAENPDRTGDLQKANQKDFSLSLSQLSYSGLGDLA